MASRPPPGCAWRGSARARGFHRLWRVAALHDRMPVILGEADWSLWLGEREGNVGALLRPCPSEWLRVWPVSKAVNSVRNKCPSGKMLNRVNRL